MSKKSRRAKARRALLTLSLVLVVAFAAVGGTLAWLQDTTQTVTNTFSPSNIDVTLQESDSAYDSDNDVNNNEYQIVPGMNITKDPTVKASSNVDYYVFVKVTEENWPTWAENKFYYTVDNYWSELEGDFGTGVKVYYKELSAGTAVGTESAGQSVIAGNTVYVDKSVTTAELAQITSNPKITVQAYAIQKNGLVNAQGTAVSGAAAAWEIVSAQAAAN